MQVDPVEAASEVDTTDKQPKIQVYFVLVPHYAAHVGVDVHANVIRVRREAKVDGAARYEDAAWAREAGKY
jgi:hypothetical protein